MSKMRIPSDEDIAEAYLRAERSKEPSAEKVGFERENRKVFLQMRGGLTLSFSPESVPEFLGLADSDLEGLTLSPSGMGLSLRDKDIDISIGGLVLELLDASGWCQVIRSQVARESAQILSPARARASQENGRKGGRPSKSKLGEAAKPAATPGLATEGGSRPRGGSWTQVEAKPPDGPVACAKTARPRKQSSRPAGDLHAR